MLVLSLKPSKGLTIAHPAGDIYVVLVEMRGDKVRLGIEADKSIPIVRDDAIVRIRTVSAALADDKLSECEDAMDIEDNLQGCGAEYIRLERAACLANKGADVEPAE